MISKSLLFLTLIGILFMYGCQKDNLQQVAPEATIEQTNNDPLTLQKITLKYIFQVQTESLSDEEILQQYDELIQLLPQEDRNNMIEMVKQVLSQTQVNSVSAQGISTRAVETLLTNGAPDDGFGQGVATVGNMVYVGASGEQKVYEYSKTGGSYTLTDEITPTGASDDFGTHVSVSGNWMAVSAPDFGQPFGRPGQLFLFKKQGGSWVQKDILTGPAGETNFSGQGMVLKGNKLAAISMATGFPSPGGTISVFELSGNNWSLSGTIFEPTYDWFGVDMDDGGNRIVGTGAVGNSLICARAVIFEEQGSNWVLDDEVIVGCFFTDGVAFPRDVAIQNNTVVLTTLVPENKQYVITKNQGSWSVDQELDHPAGLPFENRWAEIQGSTIIIGAASRDNAISDAVHVFKKSGNNWNYDETLTPSDNGVDARMWNIAISGNTIVAGVPGANFPPPIAPGKAYVFD